MGKKRMYLLCVVICLYILFITGCNSINSEVKDYDKENIEVNIEENMQLEQTKYSTLEDLPEDFSLQDAKDAGMLVLEEMNITNGLEEWKGFLAKTMSGEADKIMIAKYYELGDASHYSAEYYEEIKDDYPVMYIFLLSFDGSTYTMTNYEDAQIYKYEYDYLIERIGKLANAAIAEHFFALVNDSELSYHDITWSMLSSQFPNVVDFKYVFHESITLGDYYSRRPGLYKTEDGLAWLKLDENCEFSFNRNVATSYDPSGRYYVDGDLLVLHVNEEEEYIFEIIGDGILKFVSGDYAEGFVNIGVEFIYETE